ncbi:hypothetical protein K440DRAFT_625794 [Wilcoxina mikolae CBS 423.85]|nr:hypothetical protein K440DRAFT_625794 [Wilcoxina mikolae CBS 423.85]
MVVCSRAIFGCLVWYPALSGNQGGHIRVFHFMYTYDPASLLYAWARPKSTPNKELVGLLCTTHSPQPELHSYPSEVSPLQHI